MSQAINLGRWQEEIVSVSQKGRLGYQAISAEPAEWSTRLRVRMVWAVILLLFAVVVSRVVYLHVFEANQQLLLSETNHLEQVRITAKRGSIVDRQGVVLAESILGEEAEVATPGAWHRRYPLGSAAAPVIGYLSEVTKEELGCREGLCYTLGMRVGRAGVERTLEQRLRGNDGGIIHEVDATGAVVRERGRNESEGGSAVRLTIDAKLQQFAYQAMEETRVEGKGVKGAVVAMDMQGAVLALVSFPTYDPSEVVKYLGNTEENYFLNRATHGIYPPGSVFKMVTGYAALLSGRVDKQTEVEDTGEIRVGEYRYGTWNFDQTGKTEGKLDLVRALARSNDIYFYRIGETVGVGGIVTMAKKFGLGQSTGLGVLSEAAGLVPDPLWKERRTGESWFLGNTYHLAIGQGDLLATPLQVARMSAAVVTGRVCRARLLGEEKAECEDLGIPTEQIEVVREGMRAACATGGTAFPLFEFEPYVLCKTGTAQHAGQNLLAGSGPSENDVLPHAWITVAYPGENPTMVLTVIVEEGGEGSAVAGPIAKRILEGWKTISK